MLLNRNPTLSAVPLDWQRCSTVQFSLCHGISSFSCTTFSFSHRLTPVLFLSHRSLQRDDLHTPSSDTVLCDPHSATSSLGCIPLNAIPGVILLHLAGRQSDVKGLNCSVSLFDLHPGVTVCLSPVYLVLLLKGR